MEKDKFGWALDSDNKLVHISQVTRGLACNCFCPGCHAPLVARKGSVNVHHFAHSSGNEDCHYGYESAVHLLAKSVLERNKTIALPPYEVSYCEKPESDPEIYSLLDGMYGYEYKYPSRTITFDEIQNEVHLGDFTPDSIAVKDGTRLLVEFRNTHAVDEDKLEKIRAFSTSCVEIDIRGFKLARSKEDDVANMERFLAEEASEHSKWIFNPKIRELAKKDLLKAREERAPELEEQQRHRQWEQDGEAVINALKTNYHKLLDISRQEHSQNDCLFTVTLRKLADTPYGSITAIQKILYKPYSWNGILYAVRQWSESPSTTNNKRIYFSDEERPYYVSIMVQQGQSVSYDDVIKRIIRTRYEVLNREKCAGCQYARTIYTYSAENFYYNNHTYVFCTRIEAIPDLLSIFLQGDRHAIR